MTEGQPLGHNTTQQGCDTAQQRLTTRRRGAATRMAACTEREWHGLCVAMQFLYHGQGGCDTVRQRARAGSDTVGDTCNTAGEGAMM